MTALMKPLATTVAPIERFSLVPKTFAEAMQYAELLAKSTFVPESYRGKPGDVFAAIMMGLDVGFSPMQALQSIAVINGRPTIWGDGMKALIISQPDCLMFHEMDFPEIRAAKKATCTIVRARFKDHPTIKSYSTEDAQTGGLANKQGAWQTAPWRMLQLRARAFACRDAFPDVLRGLRMAEEQQDIVDVDVTVSDKPHSAQQMAEPEIVNTPARRDAVKAKIKKKLTEPDAQALAPDPDKVILAIEMAADHDQLNGVSQMAALIADEGERERARKAFVLRYNEIAAAMREELAQQKDDGESLQEPGEDS